MKLSIIIPVYNEEKTINQLLEKVSKVKIEGVEKEIIVVDDGSNDASTSIISNIKFPISNFKFVKHKINLGKGCAVKTGITYAKGDYIIIQDADLEYDPKYITKLTEPVLLKKAEVVYGTRLDRMPNFSSEEKTPLFILHYLGNRLLSLVTSMLYGQWITDMETCYKLFPKSAAKKMKLYAKGFEFEPEITAKLLKMGYKIKEIPITTKPRDYKAGKKLNAFKEGPKALVTLIKYRFVD
jgi:glycosyltransferase involved in cell wall biosynthesis